MKKVFIFLVFFSFIIGNVSAQDALAPNKRLKSGVWLKFGYDVTFTNFLTTEDVNSTERAANNGLDFQLGSTFYIGPRIANMLRFGLDANWLDFSYFKLKSHYFTNGTDYFLNAFEVGPIISFSPVKYIAFDLYGRVVPSFSLMYYEAPGTTSSNTSYTYFGYNTNGLIGASFRVAVFSVGFEYNFGKMAYTDTKDSEATKGSKVFINNLRLLIGLKF